jgi:DNA-binding NarL/FixJ family response regulator
MTARLKQRPRSDLPYNGPSIRVTRVTPGLPKVLILHDVPVVVEAMKVLLNNHAFVVGETYSGKSALSMCELMTPDVVIIGEMLSDGVAEYYVPTLLQTGSRVLLVSHLSETSSALGLVELGVTGIIDGSNAPDDIVNAVIVLAAGGAFLPSDVVASIAGDWRRSRRRGTNEVHGTELTGREVEVMGAMSDGLSTKAIAHHLGIAVKTVENHKTRIFDKLGVRSQAQAVALIHGKRDGSPAPFAFEASGKRGSK